MASIVLSLRPRHERAVLADMTSGGLVARLEMAREPLDAKSGSQGFGQVVTTLLVLTI
jgi:hypothetical protein